MNSTWIKNLNIKPEIIKLLEENIGSKYLDTGLGNELLDLITKAKSTKINKWNYIKLKKLFQSKGNHQQNEKTTYGIGENIFK